MGSNVEEIRARGMRVINGRVPAAVRKELNAAVKEGELGHFKADGLLPEMYYHPDQFWTAKEKRVTEAKYSASLIAKVVG